MEALPDSCGEKKGGYITAEAQTKRPFNQHIPVCKIESGIIHSHNTQYIFPLGNHKNSYVPFRIEQNPSRKCIVTIEWILSKRLMPS